jgi:hypothetical protein
MDLTEEDIRSQKREHMGEALGDLCFFLWKELSWLHVKWEEFRTLYGTSEKEIALMNAVAPNFFGRLQQILWEDLMLHISRLTDPPKSAGRDNLSLRRLPMLVGDPGLKVKVEGLVAAAVTRSDFARDWRNRYLAHSDLLHAENPSLHALAPASRRDVKETLAEISKPVNVLELRFEGSPTSFEHSIPSLQGAAALLGFMRRNVTAEKGVPYLGARKTKHGP